MIVCFWLCHGSCSIGIVRWAEFDQAPVCLLRRNSQLDHRRDPLFTRERRRLDGLGGHRDLVGGEVRQHLFHGSAGASPFLVAGG